jgi:hypothetical protein
MLILRCAVGEAPPAAPGGRGPTGTRAGTGRPEGGVGRHTLASLTAVLTAEMREQGGSVPQGSIGKLVPKLSWPLKRQGGEYTFSELLTACGLEAHRMEAPLSTATYVTLKRDKQAPPPPRVPVAVALPAAAPAPSPSSGSVSVRPPTALVETEQLRTPTLPPEPVVRAVSLNRFRHTLETAILASSNGILTGAELAAMLPPARWPRTHGCGPSGGPRPHRRRGGVPPRRHEGDPRAAG